MDNFFMLNETEKQEIKQLQEYLHQAAEQSSVNMMLIVLYKMKKMEERLTTIQELISTRWVR